MVAVVAWPLASNILFPYDFPACTVWGAQGFSVGGLKRGEKPVSLVAVVHPYFCYLLSLSTAEVRLGYAYEKPNTLTFAERFDMKNMPALETRTPTVRLS